MFYDLDVNIPRQAHEQALQTLQTLGYDVVAFTTTVSGERKLTADHLPPAVDYSAWKQPRTTLLHPEKSKRHRGLTVLQRITIVIDDHSQLSIFGCPELSKFDLVAVRPANEKLFQQCLQFDFDIVSLPMDKRHSFQVKRPHVHVVAEKGILFEIAYAGALRDSATRRNVIANASAVAAATNGKHLLLSSGASTAMELRAPLDVINLGTLLNVPQHLARDAVIDNAQAAVTHGDVRARVHKGIVRLDKIDATDPPHGGGGDDDATAAVK